MPLPHPPHFSPAPIGFGATCLRATLYMLLIAGLMQGIQYEALTRSTTRFSEYGMVELVGSLVLAIIASLLLFVRHVQKALPTVTLLMLAFVVSSLIREQDHFLDAHVFDGAWQTLVALTLLPCITVVVIRRQCFLAEFVCFSNSFSFGMFAAGFLVTYVFSRLYGRSEMWMAILGEHYQRTFKDAAEETTELLGYTLILIAVIEMVFLARRWRLDRATANDTHE